MSAIKNHKWAKKQKNSATKKIQNSFLSLGFEICNFRVLLVHCEKMFICLLVVELGSIDKDIRTVGSWVFVEKKI